MSDYEHRFNDSCSTSMVKRSICPSSSSDSTWSSSSFEQSASKEIIFDHGHKSKEYSFDSGLYLQCYHIRTQYTIFDLSTYIRTPASSSRIATSSGKLSVGSEYEKHRYIKLCWSFAPCRLFKSFVIVVGEKRDLTN